MGAGASAQLPATVDVATQRRLGGVCYLTHRLEAYGDIADPNAVPRERVLAEAQRRGLDEHGAVFWANLRHFFKVRNGLDDTWAKVPNSEAVERGIAALDRLKKQSGDERRAYAVDTFELVEMVATQGFTFLSLMAGDEFVLDKEPPPIDIRTMRSALSHVTGKALGLLGGVFAR